MRKSGESAVPFVIHAVPIFDGSPSAPNWAGSFSPDAWTTLTAGHGLGWDEAEELTRGALARLLLSRAARGR